MDKESHRRDERSNITEHSVMQSGFYSFEWIHKGYTVDGRRVNYKTQVLKKHARIEGDKSGWQAISTEIHLKIMLSSA